MPYLIDGHNVIAALPDINLEDEYDEAQLVLKLRTWTSRIRRKAIVVFDGGIAGGPSPDLSSPAVLVVFAARFHTNADRIIRERLKALRDAPNWTVVSSDREVLDQAQLAGAKTLSAQLFAERLNQPPTPEKEKPDYVSPAAVNGWLEVFPEPDPTAGPGSTVPIELPEQPEVQSKPPRQKMAKVRAQPPQERRMRSIGEQLGREASPQPEPVERSIPSEKPDDVSSEEVEAWLQVFHDPVESSIPKPKLPQKTVKPQRPKYPVVRKQGDLSQDEVSVWLDVFPEPAPEAEPGELAAPAKKRRHRQRDLDKTLAQHKAKLIGPENIEKSSLSEEDLELWQRMFGSEE